MQYHTNSCNWVLIINNLWTKCLSSKYETAVQIFDGGRLVMAPWEYGLAPSHKLPRYYRWMMDTIFCWFPTRVFHYREFSWVISTTIEIRVVFYALQLYVTNCEMTMNTPKQRSCSSRNALSNFQNQWKWIVTFYSKPEAHFLRHWNDCIFPVMDIPKARNSCLKCT